NLTWRDFPFEPDGCTRTGGNRGVLPTRLAANFARQISPDVLNADRPHTKVTRLPTLDTSNKERRQAMTKNYELNDNLARAGAYTNFKDSAAAPRHAAQTHSPVTFDGLLTNKILTGLPGADFARLLPHLEPV